MGLKNSRHLANPGVNAWASGKTSTIVFDDPTTVIRSRLDFFSKLLGGLVLRQARGSIILTVWATAEMAKLSGVTRAVIHRDILSATMLL